MKTLLGIVTFGNLEFTKLTVKSILETTKAPLDVFIVVGKPGDNETAEWVKAENIAHIIHDKNYGFPKSVNDIYDYAWVHNDYDYLILAGNDIVAYPYAIDSLVNFATETDYEVISALQYDVRSLILEFPETQKNFEGPNCIIRNFDDKPWEKFTGYSSVYSVGDMRLYDIQNLCLYKKSIFDKVGYTDVNFYPAYFIDNDYARRISLSTAKYCTLGNARFFHFWSRTKLQGSGGSTDHQFVNNQMYYSAKWGGVVGQETRVPNLKIDSRERELESIEFWRNR